MMSNTTKRVLIVGGVAGGASCAARLRRMDEGVEIVMIERGPYVSFANCGLPYYVGDVIRDESKLLVANRELFENRFRVQVWLGTEVVAIERGVKKVRVRDVETGEEREEGYDELVLSPGASPIRPPLPGIDLEGIFTVRTIPDSRVIREWMERRSAKRAVVVGGGFIGLEMAENLIHRGMDVTVVEMLDQVMPPLDSEVAALFQKHMEARGVKFALGDGVASFERTGEGLTVRTAGGREHSADLVILAIGVRPETGLAKACGLELGERGGIRVDEHMRTSDPSIYAVGDAVEKHDIVSGTQTLLPLAGPANRQGRIAADAIAGSPRAFRGVQGTAICGAFGMAVAATGLSEKALKRAQDADFEKIYVHPSSHAGYYPGAERMMLKLLFRRSDGRVLGAQAVGEDGVDKRIDVIAMAIQMGATVFDLEESELCYAPQYGGAKDPVNFAGMVAADFLRGFMPIVHWSEESGNNTVYLDVRDPDEFEEGHVPSAINIPVAELRGRLHEIPTGADLRVYCAVGIRGYLACRILEQNGIAARNLSGGYLTHKVFQ